MQSILQSRKECYLCRKIFGQAVEYGLEEHHVIFGTANRKKSEKYGLKVWLCQNHHRNGKMAVHQNRHVAELLIREAQIEFEGIYGHKKFMKEFGKNWI